MYIETPIHFNWLEQLTPDQFNPVYYLPIDQNNPLFYRRIHKDCTDHIHSASFLFGTAIENHTLRVHTTAGWERDEGIHVEDIWEDMPHFSAQYNSLGGIEKLSYYDHPYKDTLMYVMFADRMPFVVPIGALLFEEGHFLEESTTYDFLRSTVRVNQHEEVLSFAAFNPNDQLLQTLEVPMQICGQSILLNQNPAINYTFPSAAFSYTPPLNI